MTTKLIGLCGNRLQTSLYINSLYTTILITIFKQQKYDITLLTINFGGISNFQTVQDKFSLG